METVSHHGRTVAYRATDFGDGPRVCYVHGAAGTHGVWVHQYGDRDGPPAAAVDLAGHGDSGDVDAEPGRATLDAYADDVVAVREATGASVLCGNSMGGAVALWTMLERDVDVEALVLVDSGATVPVDDGLLEALDRNFESAVASIHVPGTLFYEPDEDLTDVTTRGFLETGPAVTLRDFRTCDVFDVSDCLDAVPCPTRVVAGEHDRLIPTRYQRELAETLPDGEYLELADAGHVPMLERPSAFNEAIRSFLL
jgi:pimeloyl-ACP methyl ester carboxylesterase